MPTFLVNVAKLHLPRVGDQNLNAVRGPQLRRCTRSAAQVAQCHLDKAGLTALRPVKHL